MQAKEVTWTGSREHGFHEKEKGQGVGGAGGSQIESRVEMDENLSDNLEFAELHEVETHTASELARLSWNSLLFRLLYLPH